MTSINELNRRLFNLAPARWVGKYIYNWQRRHQLRTQSTSTKFFRNLQQLAALEGPLANLTKTGNLSVLVAGCSYGCEAYSLGRATGVAISSIELADRCRRYFP